MFAGSSSNVRIEQIGSGIVANEECQLIYSPLRDKTVLRMASLNSLASRCSVERFAKNVRETEEKLGVSTYEYGYRWYEIDPFF